MKKLELRNDVFKKFEQEMSVRETIPAVEKTSLDTFQESKNQRLWTG